MNKNFLTVAAISVVAFFVSTEIAKAADITFSGKIRTRWELNEQSNGGGDGTNLTEDTAAGFNDRTDPDDFIQSQVRLNAHANINETTSAFIQMQSNRTWGNSSSTAGANGGGGSGNSSFSANDGDSSVGVHQAYFTLKNIGDLHGGHLMMDAKVGRQEIILDGHRLYGNTIWTQGQQTHDAIRLTHAHDNMTLNLGYILGQEDGRRADAGDTNDIDVWLAHLNLKGILGGQFSAIYTYFNQGCGADNVAAADGTNTNCASAENDFHTIGGRQAGQLFGFDYRGEIYYQFGNATGVANVAGTSGLAVSDGGSVDRSAYMFGLRVGKTFKNVQFKPGITLFYDHLSGTSDENARDGDWHSFNTLFDTGHKFYGLMDTFLGIGSGTGSGTAGLGLQDFAVKLKLNPMPGWVFKFDAHSFHTTEGMVNTGVTGISNAQISSGRGAGGAPTGYLGHEFDLTLVNKYNANTVMSIGYSNFNATQSFKDLKSTTANQVIGSDDANWAYVQFDVKF